MSDNRNSTASALASTDDMPWLVFKLKDEVFAIHSANVETIFQFNQNLFDMPELSGNMAGVINLRGKVIPLMYLRQVMGLEAFETEMNQFSDMLEQRKHDHLIWVEDFKRCLDTDEPFTKATDPHKCTFGGWLDSYTPSDPSVKLHLNKMDAPHKLLHESAAKVFACPKDHDNCTRPVCLKEEAINIANQTVEILMTLFEQAKTVFAESYKQMCVVIGDEKSSLGLLVDEVIAVEKLSIIDTGTNFDDLYHSKIVTNVAQGDSTQKQILLLDADLLINLAK